MSKRKVAFMQKKNEEQLVYIKDLVFAALRGWKAIVAAALVLGLLLGGMQVVSGMSAGGSAVPEETLAQSTADKEALTELLEIAKKNKENHQTYLSQSVLMQLDPYSHYEVTISLYAKTDYQILPGMNYQNPDATKDVLKTYERALLGSEGVNAVMQALQVENQYASELMTSKTDDRSNTMVLTVKLPTQEQGEAVLQALLAQVDVIRAQVKEGMGAHTLTVTGQSVTAKVDADLADAQAKRRARTAELNKAIAEAKEAVAAVEIPVAQKTGLKSILKKGIIFAVLGAVVGAFLTVCVLWVMHITSDKVYAARNLTNRTGVKVIGTVGCEKKNCIDRLIYRLEGRSEWDLQASPVAVDVCCRAKQAKHLLITGSGDQKDREALVQEIAKQLPDTRVEDCGSILCSAEALKALAACDAVLLVEANGVSKYTDVEKQTEIICDYEKNILGCVLFEK